MVNIPGPGEVLAAFFVGGRQAGPGEVTFGPCDWIEPRPDEPVPYTPLPRAEPEPEAGP